MKYKADLELCPCHRVAGNVCRLALPVTMFTHGIVCLLQYSKTQSDYFYFVGIKPLLQK